MASSHFFCPHCGAANQRPETFTKDTHCFACGQTLIDAALEQQSDSLFIEESPSEPLLLNRYKILSQVGTGGFGAVYKAEDMQVNHQIVAVKEISLQGLKPHEIIEATDSFNREVQILSGLTHPNLPRMYDHTTDTEHWYLIMEFIEGDTLEEYLHKTGRLSIDKVLDIAIQLCTVLDVLHTCQPPIIFRDLKPSNIMATRKGHIYLIDFGIARRFKPGQARDTIALGSPGYAAPEQYGKTQTAPSADMYSLGATLHYLLTGIDPSEIPFRFEPIPSVPPELETLIMQMVQVDTSKRPDSMGDVKRVLRHIVEQRAVEQGPIAVGSAARGGNLSHQSIPAKHGLSRRGVIWGLVGLAALGLTGSGVARLAANLIASPSIDTGPGIEPPLSTIIKIGSDLPVSEHDLMDGKPIENGVHLAIDHANANHMIPGHILEFIPKDDVGPSGSHDPATGRQNVTDLIGDALVAGIIGPFNSSVALAEMPMANQAPIALISPSTTMPCLTVETRETGCIGANDLLPRLRPTGKVTYFRLSTPDNYQGQAMARYLFDTAGYRKAYVIDDAELYGVELVKSFISAWQQLGGTIIEYRSFPPTATSYISQLTQIAATNPDVLYFGGTDSTGGTLIRQQMQQVPTLKNTPFAGGNGILSNSFASAIGLTGGPVYATVPGPNTTRSSATQDFIANYKAIYGANSYGSGSASGYDCASILIQAIKVVLVRGVTSPRDSSDMTQARVFREAIIDAIQHISYDGITGHHSFDANGDTTNRVISVYQLTNGKDGWKYLTQLTVK